MSQAVTVLIPELYPFYLRVARGVTTYVSGMKDVTLGNGAMEATRAIAIPSWSAFSDTVYQALKIWSYDVHDGSPLSFPIPENFLNLVKLNVDTKMKDSQGEVQLKVDRLEEVTTYDDEHVAALFGDDGFFPQYYNMYSGVEYKKSDSLVLVNGKETVLDDQSKESTSYKDKSYSLDTIPICVGVGAFICGLDGCDQDVVGLASLCPFKTAIDEKQIMERCMLFNMPNQGSIDVEEIAERATHWVMTTKNRRNYAVRSYLPIETEEALLTTHIQAIINGVAKTPSKDIVASFPPMDPDTLGEGQTEAGLPYNKLAIAVGLAVSNPHTQTIDTDIGWQAYHTLSERARNTATPTVVTESIRSHRSRFVTYSGKGIHSGFIQCLIDSQELLQKGTTQTLANLLSSPKNPNDHNQAMLMIYRHLTYMDTLTRACSAFLTMSSMISVDNNRLPISQKYIVKVRSPDLQDATGLNVSFMDQDDYLSENDVLKYLVRIPLYGNRDDEKNNLYYFGLALERPDDEKYVWYTEIKKVMAGAPDDKTVNQVANDILSDPDSASFINNSHGSNKSYVSKITDYINRNIGEQGKVEGSLYYFTKLAGVKLRVLARDLKDSLHFPYVKEQKGEARTSLTGAGYSRVERSYNNNHWTVADASRKNPATDKPISNNGVILKYLSVKGGGGIFSFLGPIVGSIADGIGIPVLGDVARTVGSVIPF